VIQPDTAPGLLGDHEPLLPRAACLADIMDQPEIPREISGVERSGELTGTVCCGTQMIIQPVPYPVRVGAMRPQPAHDLLLSKPPR
jgi:hypothetical protein